MTDKVSAKGSDGNLIYVGDTVEVVDDGGARWFWGKKGQHFVVTGIDPSSENSEPIIRGSR